MMNDIFLLYILTRLNTITNVCIGILTFTLFSLPFFALFVHMKWFTLRQLKRLIWIPIISVVMIAITPSKNDALFIIAGTGIIRIAHDPDVQRVAGKSAQLVENYLDHLLLESKSQKGKR